VPDQALPLKFDQRPEGLGERTGLRSLGVAEPEVDQVERLQAEGFEVVVHRAARAPAWSAGGPMTHGPANCMAP
jgi:hypothetical protein